MSRPRKQDAIDIRARAIDETISLLRLDPSALSLGSIARRIGCSAPALYAHFANKDDLLEQARVTALADLLAEKRRRYAAKGGDPLMRLDEGGRAFIDFASENPALYRLIFAPGHVQTGSAVTLEVTTIVPLANGIRAGQAAGLVVDGDSERLAWTMWFAVHGAIMMVLDGQVSDAGGDRWSSAHATVDTVMGLIKKS